MLKKIRGYQNEKIDNLLLFLVDFSYTIMYNMIVRWVDGIVGDYLGLQNLKKLVRVQLHSPQLDMITNSDTSPSICIIALKK